ncbi:MAG TPA: hypothetical protein VF017_18820 [Thermoanaerobaculia bacterium]|nr:hypothetical protein [Thermoanaerobaculia bacterium]
MLKPILRPRRMLLALAFLAAASLASALLPAPSTDAACPKIVVTDYFFDAAKTQYAGTCVRTCSGTLNCWGTITIYKITESEPCGC